MLPLREGPALNPPHPSSLGHRVLLVDKDANDLKYFASLLRGVGYSVQAFTDHREAEAGLEDGYYDLVILCLGDPVLETHRVTRYAIGHNRYTPVLVLSRRPDIHCYVQAIQHGATDYLEKPRTPAELKRLVAAYCEPRPGATNPLDSQESDV
jgi:DNA-binding response OmpR family regulator